MNCYIIAKFVGHASTAGNNWSALAAPERGAFLSAVGQKVFPESGLCPTCFATGNIPLNDSIYEYESLQQKSTRDIMPLCPGAPVPTQPCAHHLLEHTHQQLALAIRTHVMSDLKWTLQSFRLILHSSKANKHQSIWLPFWLISLRLSGRWQALCVGSFKYPTC